MLYTLDRVLARRCRATREEQHEQAIHHHGSCCEFVEHVNGSPGGGVAFHALAARQSTNCPSPLTSFNPATASESEIAMYGLPRRPTDPAALRTYLDVWGRKLYRICITSSQRLNVRTVPPSISPINRSSPINGASQGYSGKWAGILQYTTTFKWAQSQFTINCPPSSRIGNDVLGYSQWVGLGGAYQGDSLWQAGWDGIRDTFWYEQVGGSYDTGGEVPFGPSGSSHCGHTAQIYVDQDWSYPNGTYTSVVDTTTGQYATTWGKFQYNQADNHYADYIDERPTCSNGTITGLADYNYGNWYDAAWGDSNGNQQPLDTGNFSYLTMTDSSGTTLAWVSWWSSGGFETIWSGYGGDITCIA